MLCENPVPTNVGMVPCRKCLSCRINLQRTWAARIQLEALFHPYSSFVTLTYNQQSMPVNEYGLSTLYPRHLRLFLKRLRNSNGSFRFFGCGEYGTQTERAHYHVVLFGVSIMWEPLISAAWCDPETKETMGFISIYELNEARAAYVAQYTTKKLTGTNAVGLHGREPEFSRSSMRPGIGATAVNWLADQHRTRLGSAELAKQGDVFTSIRINGKIWPIGQYLRKKLRLNLGVPQTALERAVMFDQVYKPDPDEWACPLEDYCPNNDIITVLTPMRKITDEKESKAALPEIRAKAAHNFRKIKRRSGKTINV